MRGPRSCMAALAGGNYLLGDGRQAGDLRVAMALAPEILALARDGRAARPDDIAAELDPLLIASPVLGGRGETAIPHVWRKTSADGARRWTAVSAGSPIRTWPMSRLTKGRAKILQPTATGALVTRPVGAGTQRIRGTEPLGAPLPSLTDAGARPRAQNRLMSVRYLSTGGSSE